MARRIDTEGEIDYIRLKEQGADPSTPPSGYSYMYSKTDGRLYWRTDGGITYGPLAQKVDWESYSGSATVEGWSSYTVYDLYYSAIGDRVHVSIDIVGTSNSTGTIVSLPYQNEDVRISGVFRVQNNGSASFGWGTCPKGESNLTFTPDATVASQWTGSGTKSVRGFIVYEKA